MDATTEQAVDPKEFIAGRDAAQQAIREGKEPPAPAAKAEPAKTVAAKSEESDDHSPNLSRSQRREMNRLREEAAELRGKLSAIQEFGLAKKVEAATAPKDEEPQRKDYADDATYQRALGRWDARQETKAELAKRDEATGQTEAQRQLEAQVQAANAKFQADVAQIDNWDEIRKAAEESDEQPEYVPAEHPGLMTLIATSDAQAFVLAHLATHPADMQRLLDLTAKPADQIQLFRRLEGRAEMVYSKPEKAAQATSHAGKTAITPEKAEQARGTAAAVKTAIPKPSAEVAARGGSPAPEEPTAGTKAWMERRDAMFKAR